MAITCPTGFDRDGLRAAVRETYSRVALDPDGDDFHFHRGPGYAADALGYDAGELAALPAIATAPFAGVANPHAAGPVSPGETVLDVGSGGGTDLLLSARKVGENGRAIGVDPNPDMRATAREAADKAGLGGVVEIREGDAESLPADDASVDVVQSNGVLNLTPDKRRAFAEIARVLKPGGRLHLGDVVIDVELNEHERRDHGLWAACVGGALLESELAPLAEEVGLTDTRIVARHDAFGGTPVEDKVADVVGVHGVTFFARKPA